MGERLDLTADQGANFELSFQVNDDTNTPIDLDTYTVAGQIRKNYSSNTAVDFDASFSNTSSILLKLTAAQTSNMEAGRYIYDVQITDDSERVTRVVEGVFTVTPSVTRA